MFPTLRHAKSFSLFFDKFVLMYISAGFHISDATFQYSHVLRIIKRINGNFERNSFLICNFSEKNINCSRNCEPHGSASVLSFFFY